MTPSAGGSVTSDDAAAQDAVFTSELLAQVEELEPKAREAWPDSFAGVWLSESKVFIAFSADAKENVAELAASFPRPDLLEPVPVEHSLATLEKRQMQIVHDRTAIQAGQLRIAALGDGLYDVNIDVPTNRLQVIMAKTSADARQAVSSLYGDDVELVEGPIAEPATCTRADCRYELRAGLETAGGGDLCTTAFVVKKDSGARFIMSAAHCGGGGGGDLDVDRYHGGEIYGKVKDQKYEDRVDAERMSITGSFSGKPWIFRNTNLKSWSVQSVGDWDGLLLNVSGFCKTGVTQGEDCGQFQSKNYSPAYVSNGNRFLKSEGICVKPGDSGGAVYRLDGNRAIGVVSGATNTLARGDAQYFSVHGHIQYAANALNVTVVQD